MLRNATVLDAEQLSMYTRFNQARLGCAALAFFHYIQHWHSSRYRTSTLRVHECYYFWYCCMKTPRRSCSFHHLISIDHGVSILRYIDK